MLFQGVSRFLRDEDGSYTLWSLAWFMVYVGIGGLAVDATDVFRHQNFLQATADSASVAGVMSLDDPDEAVNYALAFAENNMERNVHGNVLVESEVQLGYWDTGARTFYPNEPTKNAVYVTTRRAETNQNPLGMNMLRFLGLVGMNPWWNVDTEAVAIRYHPDCLREGFIARDALRYTNHNDFYNNICLHAQLVEMGHEGARQNTYEHGFNEDGEPFGVSISHGAPASLGYTSGTMSSNQDLQAALDAGGVTELWPSESEVVPQYISTLAGMPGTEASALADGGALEKYQSWSFLYNDSGDIALATELPEDGIFRSNTVYVLADCSGQLNLSGMTFESDTALVTSCSIHMPSGADLSAGNIIIASSDTGGGGHSIQLAAQSSLGHEGYCDTGVGGVQVYTPGTVKLSAQTDWHGVRVVAGGDVDLASHNDAYGVSVQSGGTIDFQTQGDFGLCDNVYTNGPLEWRYRLVQ